MKIINLFIMASMTLPISANAGGNLPYGCIGAAAAEFQLHPRLLHALCWAEGGKKGTAVLNVSNKSFDYGWCQINSIWMKQLSKYDISPEALSTNPMLNARVAAWRLKSEINMVGGDVWRGVGNYRSKTPIYHNEQIVRVYNKLKQIPENTNYSGEC